MISYRSNNGRTPAPYKIFNNDIGLGIVGCCCQVARGRMNVARIQEVVANHFHIPAAEMVSQRRARAVARPRQIAMFLTKELTIKSLPDIGKLFGNRDHTTVIHAVRTVKRLCDADAEFEADVEALREALR